jgi:hypothetical protein
MGLGKPSFDGGNPYVSRTTVPAVSNAENCPSELLARAGNNTAKYFKY